MTTPKGVTPPCEATTGERIRRAAKVLAIAAALTLTVATALALERQALAVATDSMQAETSTSGSTGSDAVWVLEPDFDEHL